MQYGAYVSLKYLQFFASNFWALFFIGLIIVIVLIIRKEKSNEKP